MIRCSCFALGVVVLAVLILLGCESRSAPRQSRDQSCDLVIWRVGVDLDAADDGQTVGVDGDKGKIYPIIHADSVLVIYADDWSLLPLMEEAQLILGIWPDGHVVWSTDWVRGGPPYYTAEIDPKRFRLLLRGFEKNGIFVDNELAECRVGFDCCLSSIFIKSGELRLAMIDAQELTDSLPFRDDSNPFSPTIDCVPYGGRAFAEKKDWSRSKLFYDLVWSQIRLSAASLIPPNGTPVKGRFVYKNGGSCWQEMPLEEPGATEKAEQQGAAKIAPSASDGSSSSAEEKSAEGESTLR